MANGIVSIFIATDDFSGDDLKDQLIDPVEDFQGLAQKVQEFTQKATGGVIDVQIGMRVSENDTAGLVNEETVTIDQAKLTDGDTIDIAGVQYVWRNTASSDLEVGIGSSNAEAASNLADKVNEVQPGVIIASASSGVTTLALLGDLYSANASELEKSENTSGAMTLSASSFSIAGPAKGAYKHFSGGL